MDPISSTAGIISFAFCVKDMILSWNNMRLDTQKRHVLENETKRLRCPACEERTSATTRVYEHTAGIFRQLWADALCVIQRGESGDQGGGWTNGEQWTLRRDDFARSMVQASQRAIFGPSQQEHNCIQSPGPLNSEKLASCEKDLRRHIKIQYADHSYLLVQPAPRITVKTYSRIAIAESIIKVLLLISMACAMAVMFQYGAAQKILHPEVKSSLLLRLLQGWQIPFPAFVGRGTVPSSALFLAATIMGPLSMASFYEANQNDEYQNSFLAGSVVVATGVNFSTPISALGGLICVFPKVLFIGLLISDLFHTHLRARHWPTEQRIFQIKNPRQPVCAETDTETSWDHEATIA